MKKIIFCDVDGTLVDSTDEISQQVVDYFKKLSDMDYKLAFATGRSREWVAPIAKILNVEVPIIINNGASIIKFKDDSYGAAELIYANSFSINQLKDLIAEGMDKGLTVTVTNEFDEKALNITDYVKMHQLNDRFSDAPYKIKDWNSERFTKVMFMDENITGLIKWLSDRIKVFEKDFSITTFNDKAIELGPKKSSKAEGIKTYGEIFHIDMEDIITCGDHQNDLEMLTEAGYSIAVNNAKPEIKSVASYVATLPYAEGVVEGLQYYIERNGNGNKPEN